MPSTAQLTTRTGTWHFHPIDAIGPEVRRLPRSVRVLLEGGLRHGVDVDRLRAIARGERPVSIPFHVGRVLLQDLTGVPALADLAAIRAAVAREGGSFDQVNPRVHTDLVVDHSIQVDAWGHPGAAAENARLELVRNRERFEFLKWAEQAFRGLSIVGPGNGIVHQVDLERLASCVLTEEKDGRHYVFADTVVGADSHTTMVNALGVLGWGVGGIEAVSCMLGDPIALLVPEVVGVELTGVLPAGTTATDLVLAVTQILRRHGVVGRFVEFFGPGLAGLSLPARATVANMAPEYGATCGFFPIDARTLDYLRVTGRPTEQVELVEAWARAQGIWANDAPIDWTTVVRIDLSSIEPAVAGPSRPQDRVPLTGLKEAVRSAGLADPNAGRVAIAAITSCTNTSNPSAMIAAGLLARNAAARGLSARPWVKTSLAPGSRAVTAWLDRAELTAPLADVGFHVVGYGCTTCIGNSGPVADPTAGVAVLSGNRNFEGRISPGVRANFLASPPLVVAFALAGTVDVDLSSEPIATDREGRPVFLRDLWPSDDEIAAVEAASVTPDAWRTTTPGSEDWDAIAAPRGPLYPWDPSSTHLAEPPYLRAFSRDIRPIQPILGARCLAVLGDSVTTDHISPAGAIPADAPAGRYLQEIGVPIRDLGTYGARRGDDRVLARGTLSAVANRMAPGRGRTTLSGEQTTLWEASARYRTQGIPLILLAGADYGMGSSRDQAAKGTVLLGVRAVIAKSWERIHRANLIGMGVLPLQFLEGDDATTLGLSGSEVFDVSLDDSLAPAAPVRVVATGSSGVTRFEARCRIDSAVELACYLGGGILPSIVRRELGVTPRPCSALGTSRS